MMKIEMTAQVKVEPYKRCSGIYCNDCEHACNCSMKKAVNNESTTEKQDYNV